MGRKSLEEVQNKLAMMGLSLASDDSTNSNNNVTITFQEGGKVLCLVPESSAEPATSARPCCRAMTTYLFENGKIETTFTRAKEVQPVAEKMITLGKKNTLRFLSQSPGVHHQGRCCQQAVQGDRSEVCRPQRRLHPRDPPWPAPRRRSRDGCHRARLSFESTNPSLDAVKEGFYFCVKIPRIWRILTAKGGESLMHMHESRV